MRGIYDAIRSITLYTVIKTSGYLNIFTNVSCQNSIWKFDASKDMEMINTYHVPSLCCPVSSYKNPGIIDRVNTYIITTSKT